MKKKTFMMICLAIMGMQVSKAQQSIIALHHEGNVTIFSGSKTQEAMDASIKGDTLYLSEGTFAGFNVTHGIVVLGSGEKTVFSGNITITGNDEKKDLGGYVFSGLNLLHDFVVNDSVTGLKISQCQMGNFTVNAGKFLDEGEMIMCYVRARLLLLGSEEGFSVLSSKVWAVQQGGNHDGSVVFNHCNINHAQEDRGSGWNNDDSKNTYQNCIINNFLMSTFINCLRVRCHSAFASDRGPKASLNCFGDIKFTFDDKMNCSLSDDSLKTAGCIGDDGTVVGITGGEIPYTLELPTPHIVEHKVDVDNVNRKLTVTLKMAHEATKEDE